jgi:hypothetical protein
MRSQLVGLRRWLRCEDLAVVVEASFWLMDEAEILFRRQNYGRIQQALTRVVVKSKDSELISRISAHPDIAMEIHEEIVRRWGPEVAAASCAAFYDQQCSMGMEPESYIGSARWLDPLGGTVLFDGQSCKATGFTVESRSPRSPSALVHRRINLTSMHSRASVLRHHCHPLALRLDHSRRT